MASSKAIRLIKLTSPGLETLINVAILEACQGGLWLEGVSRL